VGAGLTTTAWSLTNASYYIIANPAIEAALRKELWEAIPDLTADDAFNFAKLERLPYLKGCIREGIRLSHGVSGRNPRRNPQPLPFKEYVIPAWIPVSMTIHDVQFNPTIYPSPTSFVPERWIKPSKTADGHSLEHYWVAFGKGNRACLGINLAYMELFKAVAVLFRKFKMELYETDETDVLLKHDFFLPSPRLDSKGVRVKISEVES
jgi:cytochrome P450